MRRFALCLAALLTITACESAPSDGPDGTDTSQPGDTSQPDTSEPGDTAGPGDSSQADTAGPGDTSQPDTDASCEVCATDEDCAGAEGVGPCMVATCDTTACACVVAPAADGTACDDGDACTTGDQCLAGACAGPAAACDDGDACTADVCTPTPGCPAGGSPVDGACYELVKADAALSWDAAEASCAEAGGHLLTVDDAAENARLAGGLAETCGDEPAWIGLALTDGAPAWASGAAVAFTAWAAGEPGAHASGGVVLDAAGAWHVATADTACVICELAPRAYTCTTALVVDPPVGVVEVCDGVDNNCDGATDEDTAAECDDGDACTVDTCGGAEGCQHVSSPAACDDGNPCTVDSCDPTLGCQNVPDDAACDDGFACTTDTCDAALGCVFAPSDAACDDGQGCTTDHCDPAAGCVYDADDAACDDGLACTADQCQPHVGCVQVADPVACDDGNPCTDDACVTGQGCVHTATTAPCDDGDVCTVNDTCVNGACVAGPPRACDDGLPCTADQCQPDVGCVAPPVVECDSPGPLGGLYEGVFHIDGTYSVFGVPGAVTCDAPVSIVVDASGDPTVHGAGDARCELSVVNVDGFALAPMSGVATGTLDGTTINATLHVGTLTLSGLVGAIAVGDDGVPTGMSGTGSGAIPKSELLAVTSGDLRAAISAGGASSAPYTTTFWATHKRVDGTCCGPAPIGCEPSDDTSCNARGWTFAAAGAGRCCDDTTCSPLTERACATLGLDYVPSGLGACCLESGCEAIPGVLCEQLGGTFANAGSCADGNDDGFSDVCGPPPTYGYDAPPGCALDGDTLTVNVGGVVDLAFESDAWTLDGATYSAGTRLGLQTPLGTVEIPDVTDFDVSCGQPFGILGRIASPPSFAGIDAFASLGATTSAPDLSVGYGFGYQLADLGIDAPFADARPYFFAHAERGVELAISDAVAVRLSEGDNFDVLVDPDDPAVIFSVGGDSLHHGTGGLVKQVGIGLSYNGNLTLRSKRDLWNGSTFGPFVATGHVYRAGEFALIPLPGFEETNIYLDGDILVDVGSSVDLIEPIAKSLIEGDLGAIEDGLAAIGSQESVEDVVSEMSMAGNANSYKIEVGPLEVTVGSASWAWRDGTLTFSGEGLTPGAALASGDAGSLFKAFSSLTLQATGKVWGYVNSEGFSITTEADLVAGPFNLHDVRLIIDSHKGVRIEGGAFGFDLGAFLAQLETLMDCDFSASGASCSIGGIPIASLSGGLDDQGFRLAGSAGLPVLGSVAFSALIGDNGHFAFKGRASQGLPGFQTSDVEVVVTDHAFGITTGWSQFGQYISLSGTIGYDGSFELTGTGGLRVVGYQMSGATVTLSSETGLTAVGELSLLSFGKLRATLTVPPHIGDWSFQADGKLSVLGHELASVTASASSADGLTLFLDGEVGIAGAKARLTGSLSGANFSLTGTQELRIAGYTLTSASVTLSNTGLRVAGQLGIRGQGFALSGEVESNGDFAFHSTAGVAIPFGLISLSTSASFVKEGSSVQVIGQAVGSILGINFSSQFSYSSNGLFSWSAWVSAGGSVKLKICVPKPWGGHWCHYDTIGSLSGRAEMSINNNRASFHFKGSASAGGTTVASIDIPLSIDGTVCYRFPVIGRKCLKVL